jgi:hypothetical protein
MKLGIALGLALVTAFTAAAQEKMERVDGIGGVFFKAKSPKVLAQWYSDNLGITVTPTDYNQEPWTQAAGITVFAPFPENTKYFGRPEQAFMLN